MKTGADVVTSRLSTRQLLHEAQQWRQEILDLYARSGYDKTYKVNRWWNDDNVSVMDDALLHSSDAAAAVQKIARTHLYNIQRSGGVLARAIEWQAHELAARGVHLESFPPAIAESPLVPDDICVERNGRRVSNEFFRNLYLLELCKATVACGPNGASVVELGAGMGNLARLFLLGGLARAYTIIDIPHTLVFSFMFLRMCFPDLSHLLIRTPDDVRRAKAEGHRLVFCPTLFAEQLAGERADLFVNTASLGEMPNETIRYWMNYVQRVAEPKYLLSVNRYLNANLNALPHVDGFRVDENECSVLYDHRWSVQHWNYDPHYGRCPYACRVARYLELVLKRLPAEAAECQPAAVIGRSNALLSDVIDHEEWPSLFNDRTINPGDNTMLHSFHVDTSMRGTLSKLWESVRLHPNPHNLMMMLSYLEMLRDDSAREFEEVPYYEGLFLHILNHYPGPAESLAMLRDWIRWRVGRRERLQRQHLENLRGEPPIQALWNTVCGVLDAAQGPGPAP